MTKDEALKLALDWLESGNFVYPTKIRNAITEALAQPVQQVQKDELAGVAYVDDLDLWHFYPLRETVNFPAGTKFYTTPPAAQPTEPRNFCPRCGKRTADLTTVHTCTPPEGGHQ